ncbi:MAG: sulfite exporter TauE/SafE family protein, partial [Halothiobacillus sp.]|nr:sulfite exporter TauE/SafE family protein [Halothiobacillus sp.]
TRTLPSGVPLSFFGVSVGAVGTIMGMGGGALTTPFFMWCNVAARNAMATSAAIGLPNALAGAIGYIVTGWGQPDLPSWSIGYIYLPALVGIVIPSLFFAPIGATLTHRLPAKLLKRIFAVMLVLLGLNMLIR